MKILCDTKLLTTAVINVSRAVSAKSTIPALEGILISAEDGRLTLSGYDMEIGITSTIDATVYQSGSIVLNAKLLSEIVRKVPTDKISISVEKSDENNNSTSNSENNGLATISSGISQFSISTQDSSDYPEIPCFDNNNCITINAGTLKNMIEQTIFAISVNDSKPVHMGSLVEYCDNTLSLVSVDGVRLALRKTNLKEYQESQDNINNNLDNTSFVVPGKTLSEISKLITDLEQNVKISSSKKHVVFEIENCKVISRLLEGDFLDYKTAIPKEHSTEIVVSPKELIASVERTSLVIFDKLKAPIKLVFDDNLIKFYCKSATGNAYDELPCEITGKTFEIGFNSKAMLDALKVVSDEKVKLLLNGPLSPMKIVPVDSKTDADNERFVFLVLPVRLKNDENSEN